MVIDGLGRHVGLEKSKASFCCRGHANCHKRFLQHAGCPEFLVGATGQGQHANTTRPRPRTWPGVLAGVPFRGNRSEGAGWSGHWPARILSLVRHACMHDGSARANRPEASKKLEICMRTTHLASRARYSRSLLTDAEADARGKLSETFFTLANIELCTCTLF